MDEMDYPAGYSPLRPGGMKLTRQLLSLAGEIRKRRVLDVGCGRGQTAGLLEQEYGAEVTGMDLSAVLVEECRISYPGITFITADAQSLPFAAGSFDLLVSECCYSIFSDPERALREACRVLVPGGRILLSDLWARTEAAAGNGMVRNLYSRKRWQDMLTGAGFVMMEFIDAGDVLTEMYVQMILDLGVTGAQEQLGLCLRKEEMKNVSYMLMSGIKISKKSD